MAEFLLEIGIEEVPARMLSKAATELKDGLTKLLKESGLQHDPLEAHGAPRQLLIFTRNIQLGQEDREEVIMGPPVRIAYDADGKPTRALEGFMKKVPNLGIEDLERVQQAKGEVVSARNFVKGRPTTEILAEALPEILRKLSFPKKMRWGSIAEAFVRPIRSIVALVDGEVVPFEFAGVTSGKRSFGHRFHGQAQFEVANLEDYMTQKEQNAIIVSSKQRTEMIVEQIEGHLSRIGGNLVGDPELLRELPELVETPFVVCGEFDEQFLQIPREILITSLREHQKSFCVEDSDGNLMPYFMAVASTVEDAKGLIKKGNEWVLKARLWDAHFFWGSDRKKDFETLRSKLKNLVFQADIGDYHAKTERIESLACFMAKQLNLSGETLEHIAYAARHCKTDLFTELVFEFPELQGVIGGLLLEEAGQPVEVHRAVYEHYLPLSLDGEMPEELSSAIVSIADKLDTLVGCFAVGLIPTGTKDPYALRRAAQGMIRTLMEQALPLSLKALFQHALASYRDVVDVSPEVATQVNAFTVDRVRYILKKKGYAHDLIEAVLTSDSDRVDQIIPRAEAVKAQLTRENFLSLFRNLKRMNNVIQDELHELGDTDEALFESDIEKDLWVLFSSLKPKIEAAVASSSYNEAMDAMADLVDPVETYFSPDGVFVNSEDRQQRLNRKSMLRDMRTTLALVADLTCLEVK